MYESQANIWKADLHSKVANLYGIKSKHTHKEELKEKSGDYLFSFFFLLFDAHSAPSDKERPEDFECCCCCLERPWKIGKRGVSHTSQEIRFTRNPENFQETQDDRGRKEFCGKIKRIATLRCRPGFISSCLRLRERFKFKTTSSWIFFFHGARKIQQVDGNCR